jgi:hypothetical protein
MWGTFHQLLCVIIRARREKKRVVWKDNIKMVVNEQYMAIDSSCSLWGCQYRVHFVPCGNLFVSSCKIKMIDS